MSNLINTGDLDFATIKQNLKNYLSSQEQFADYDFDGSVLSTLIDLLAYNTHYNALYTNMAINEMFIDSASKRSSLASIAKLLGYTPKSISSAKAIIDITVSGYGTNTNFLTLSPGTSFTSEVNDKEYTFSLIDAVSATKSAFDDSFVFRDVPIYEGELAEITYTQSSSTKFVIPEDKVDIETINVTVLNSTTSETVKYINAKSIVDTKSTDNVFFVKYIEGNLYEIFFGNGTFGTEVPDGSVVKISYLVSSGADANYCAVFAYLSGADPTKTYNIVTQYAAALGSAEEDKESIRLFAPMIYQAQNRAVTADDFAAIISEMYPQIESVTTWGGQDHIPPQYGKVLISAKPYGRDKFTSLEKNEFRKGILSKKSVVTVQPEFVDPIYYNIEFISNVYYSPSKTTLTPGQLSLAVTDIITEYSKTLSKFNSTFRHSYITGLIDKVDSSIVSSINTIKVRYTVEPKLNLEENYSINFYNPIAKSNTSTFYSSRFFLEGYTDRGYLKNTGDDIEFYVEDVNGVPYFVKKIGTIDFTGKITLDKMKITSLYDDVFEFVFWPESYDVIPPNGVIVRMPSNRITVNAIVDKLSQSRTAKTDHIFSPSR